jgi:serine/threonine protein kinase
MKFLTVTLVSSTGALLTSAASLLKRQELEKVFIGPEVDFNGHGDNPFVCNAETQNDFLGLRKQLDAGETLLRISVLGEGVDGIVYSYTQLDNTVMAVKMLKQNDIQAKEEFKNEVNLLHQLKGSGIVPNFKCSFTNTQGMFYLMQLLPGTGLNKPERLYTPDPRVKNKLDKKWIQITSQMAAIVKRLHDKNVIHLDMHQKNWILTEQGRLYIIDFSRSKDDKCAHRTPAYCWAPETKVKKLNYSLKSDVYVLGMAMYYIYEDFLSITPLTGVGAGRPRPKTMFPYMDKVSPSVRKLLQDMLKEDPNDRPTMDLVIKELKGIEKNL